LNYAETAQSIWPIIRRIAAIAIAPREGITCSGFCSDPTQLDRATSTFALRFRARFMQAGSLRSVEPHRISIDPSVARFYRHPTTSSSLPFWCAIFAPCGC